MIFGDTIPEHRILFAFRLAFVNLAEKLGGEIKGQWSCLTKLFDIIFTNEENADSTWFLPTLIGATAPIFH